MADLTSIVPGVGIDNIVLGATRPQVEAILGEGSVYGGGKSEILTYGAPHNLEISLYKGKVSQIQVKTVGTGPQGPSTKDGLRVGCPSADVATAMGAPVRETKGEFSVSVYANGIQFMFRNDVVYSITVNDAETAEEPKKKAAPKKKKDGGSELEKMDLEWFNENHDNVNSIEFENVWRASSSHTMTEKEFKDLLKYETDAALVVEGDLTVDGHVSVDDHHALIVDGTVKCKSFWAAAGVVGVNAIEAEQWLEFAADDTQRMETFDVDTIKAPIIICPHVEAEDLASSGVEYEGECNDVETQEKAFRKLLQKDFDRVLEAVMEGIDIDDDWVKENS